MNYKPAYNVYWPAERGHLVTTIILMPYPFTGPKIFCAGPNCLSQPKNLTACSAVPLQNLLWQYKNQFYWMQIIFLSGTKCFWLLKYINKFLVWQKKFRPDQNTLGPVKGQGISKFTSCASTKLLGAVLNTISFFFLVQIMIALFFWIWETSKNKLKKHSVTKNCFDLSMFQ